MMKGIYTLANDTVSNQLIALLNSIEANVGEDIAICIIPYDSRLRLVKQEIEARTNVTIFDDQASIKRWEEFAKDVWPAHPAAKKSRKNWLHEGHTIRKFCSFDGPFDKFVFYDVDSLAMKPVDDIFEKLNDYDFVFDDWEFNKPDEHAMLNYSIIGETGLFKKEDVKPKMHGMDFFGSKKGIFGEKELEKLKEKLIKDKEIGWLKGLGIWDEVPLFNYMTFRSNRSQFNFTQSPNGRERTGNVANADPFININNVLYNEEGQKPIHRIHYMGYRAEDFALLCKGIDVDINYKDVFLYYRFLEESENMPKKLTPLNFFIKTGKLINKVFSKAKKTFR